ncbi:hypothetical protein [Burkholderia cepacia]|uniref:hypothetical protein n=1 Tax=Burkholderia cepacia TaxID=292 RepID=UPI0004F7E140|nr:hypothetical protein [Burkholderia cepacia]AIO30065.1 hypothetical protein DM41_6475 [Burkholderia cepacia ATCC 25416]MCA8343909.1 hypothetical protein [Burkholderia cepacia]MCA8465789.1 hypothetical protein [Burkholderia cepacia]MDN7765498.1 hypothetical protein [Burkholderia cepacia]QCY07170.1 hypothetical protein EJ998_29825 [Burkholderia cepacia ATCC 25416]
MIYDFYSIVGIEAEHLKPMFWGINPYGEHPANLEQDSVTLNDSDEVGTYVIFHDKKGPLLQVNLATPFKTAEHDYDAQAHMRVTLRQLLVDIANQESRKPESAAIYSKFLGLIAMSVKTEIKES